MALMFWQPNCFPDVKEASKTVKATLKLLEPVFVSVVWRDENGNVITEIGRREEVYAHIQMEAVEGLELEVQLWSVLSNKMYKQSNTQSPMKGTVLVFPVQLDGKTSEQLEEGEWLYCKVFKKGEKTPLNYTKERYSQYKITFTRKEKISSLKFYGDKDCKQAISSATYGSTIYARALTRNLSGESLELKIIRKVPEWYKSDKTLHTEEAKVDDKGTAIFTIKIEKNWQDSNNNTYAAVVTEKGKSAKKDNNQSVQPFSIGKDLQYIMFVGKAPDVGDGKWCRKIYNVLIVRVKTPPISSNKTLTGKIEDEETNLNKYLSQALIQVKSEKVIDLDLSGDTDFKKKFVSGITINSSKDNRDKSWFKTSLTEYLEEKLKEHLKDDWKKYAKTIKIYYFGESGNEGGYQIDDQEALFGLLKKEGGIVIFKDPKPTFASHELLHRLGLSHSFTNSECSATAKFTYKALSTENLMDYSYLPPINEELYSLWQWQWEIANGKA